MRISWKTLFCALLLVLATLAAYRNSFHGVFLFDDEESLLKNTSLRHLKPLWAPLFPPSGGLTTSGRPLLNFSFALNYAVGDYNPLGYHVVNLAIHLLAGLTLFGIVRRTFEQPPLRSHFGKDAIWLAFAVALLWMVHPLQTEAVTYIVQRAESMAALFYLLSIYAFIRSAEEGAWRGWQGLSILACFIGVGVKETAATVPWAALLYDRAYLSTSFRQALRARWRLYLGLALSWVPLGLLIFFNHSRGGTAGFNVQHVGMEFARIQTCVILHYIYLAFWPARLVFDYGVQSMALRHLILQMILLGLLLLATLILYKRRPEIGFWAIWFFLILAPSSSFVAIATQTAAEHRMYLPLAGLLVLVWMGIYKWMGRHILPCLFFALCVAAVYGKLTFRRNSDYRDAVVIWTDTAKKCSGSVRAWMNLGGAYAAEKRIPEAIFAYKRAIRPKTAAARMMVGVLLDEINQPTEALKYFKEASALNSTQYELPYAFGTFLLKQGQLEAARQKISESIRLNLNYAPAYEALGAIFLLEGKAVRARVQFAEARRLGPDDREMQFRITHDIRALDH